ncbi:hypothetical protein K505DRAFT_383243 [Melanomma pulvis-pyrius CBS 109.77]|uniref:Uncharacterized protein n=1 Tax=Melanomma pulvis-pyrius CBS 109.77 TaxID=1314802 RepID=A0A6A6XUN6_9PLEO|nr:hypothetical protein K505DRAFT_383243 [Melanomma pulvis-pyrius CBS 109.77]
MSFKSILSLAALLPFVTAQASPYSETIDGYTFIKSGPNVLLPKIQYEMKFAHTALSILKTSIGPDGLIAALQPEIKKADTFWHDVIDSSTGSWVPADGRGIAFLPNLTAIRFAAWSQSPLADAANNDANPEHYVKRTIALANGTLESEIVEGWGGVTTHFTIPNYGTPDRVKNPFLRELPEFPIQAAGDKVLMDGTIFGVLHISVRDVKGADYGQEHDGVEIYASVWYGDGVADAHLEEEREHITVEITNLALQAQKDIESGVFNPPF